MQVHTPFGYKIVNGTVMINKLQEQIIQDIYDDYINGKSLYSIAQKLKQEKIKNNNGNTNWTHGAIAKILENKKYLGDNMYPKIIDEKKFMEVSKLRQNSKSIFKVKDEQIEVVKYPPKPPILYPSDDIKRLDELINIKASIELIYHRAETQYLESKIYDIERSFNNDY